MRRQINRCAKCLSAALMLFVAAETCAADSRFGIEYRFQGVPHSSLYGISIDGENAVAVGTFGTILSSSDGGQSWSRQAAPVEDYALIDATIAGELAMAVGQLGTVLKRQGNDWQLVDAGIQGRVLAIDANAKGKVVIGAEFGAIHYSCDAGKTWAAIRPNWRDFDDPTLVATAEPHVYGVHVADDGLLTAVGEFGVILQSADQGVTWAVRRAPKANAPTLFGLHMSDQPGVPSFAVGQRGAMLKSLDGGESWTFLQSNTDANLLGVTAFPEGQVLVTAMRAMLVSQDGGQAWHTVNDPDVQANWYLGATRSLDDRRLLAVGHSSRIIEVKF